MRKCGHSFTISSHLIILLLLISLFYAGIYVLSRSYVLLFNKTLNMFMVRNALYVKWLITARGRDVRPYLKATGRWNRKYHEVSYDRPGDPSSALRYRNVDLDPDSELDEYLATHHSQCEGAWWVWLQRLSLDVTDQYIMIMFYVKNLMFSCFIFRCIHYIWCMKRHTDVSMKMSNRVFFLNIYK